ncbi:MULTISPECIES: hypothetical protein [unclassified Streptomyces]|uniref:hypothetical protein n=1 Tax=unclassified Streptomyces TaxID=2593676 RepID=UPI0022377B7C|nr:hypothetical protein [Streptomyces sp. SHP 1-2]MCW5251346.1 hypothetical protein [Streptomyces sp. SHP 1-2]
MRTGPLFLAAGLTAYGLLLAENPFGTAVALWAVLLLVAGAGIGCAFPRLSVAAMSSGADEAEGSKAAAAVSTTRLIAFTLTSAVAGTLLAAGGADPLVSARRLVLGIAGITFPGVLRAARAAVRTPGTP